jgi:CRP/FNR family transcriptional regulator, nitrogen fixation regulation protein
MQTLQAQVGSAPHTVGAQAGKSIELAPGVIVAGFTMRFERNEEVFAWEEDADFVYKVVSGAVRDVRILSDGRRQIGAFHLAGDVFGLECGQTHLYSAEAVVDSEIALVRRSALDKAADDDAAAARKLWGLTARDLQRLQDHMLLLGRKTALERVASFLLAMAARGPSPAALDLPMSRSDIADYLGLTIETVSRTFTQLERDRAISMPTSRHIVLNNRLAFAEV